LALILGGVATDLFAQGVFGVPESGWTYIFQGDAADPGSGGFTALDGTWNPENGSAQWDGSAIGEGNPGGVSALSDGDTSFIRIQDTGDPRDSLGISDPGSNRKEYFGHDITAEGASDTIIDDGVTLYFRARVATAATGPVDDLHPDGGDANSIVPWPERGIGYYQHNGGKSPFTIKQAAAGNGANVAFGLAYGDDIDEQKYGTGGVLVLPSLKEGQELTDDSDPDEPLTQFEVANSLPVEDPTQWQDFWINIEKGSVIQDPEAP